VFGYDALDVVVEAKVDHVEDAMTTKRGGDSLAQTLRPKPMLSENLTSCRICALLLGMAGKWVDC